LNVPPTLQTVLKQLAIVAQAGYDMHQGGVLVLTYTASEIAEIHYVPTAFVATFFSSTPDLQAMAEASLRRYDPVQEYVLLAINLEHKTSACWVLDLGSS